MRFHMMNLLRRFVDVFRIDSIDMNALTGKACTECFMFAIGCRNIIFTKPCKGDSNFILNATN
ncbi:MAG: hypothetical protein LBL24_00610 [Bacteroidales bacterium]|nr:hypothetical protein [Bacteroidales bacterium]